MKRVYFCFLELHVAGVTVNSLLVPTEAGAGAPGGELWLSLLEVVLAGALHHFAGFAVHSLQLPPWGVRAPGLAVHSLQLAPWGVRAPSSQGSHASAPAGVLPSHPHLSWGKPSRLTAGPDGSGSACCGVCWVCADWAPLQGHPIRAEGLLGRPPHLGPCRRRNSTTFVVLEGTSALLVNTHKHNCEARGSSGNGRKLQAVLSAGQQLSRPCWCWKRLTLSGRQLCRLQCSPLGTPGAVSSAKQGRADVDSFRDISSRTAALLPAVACCSNGPLAAQHLPIQAVLHGHQSMTSNSIMCILPDTELYVQATQSDTVACNHRGHMQ